MFRCGCASTGAPGGWTGPRPAHPHLDEDPGTAFEVVTPIGRGWTWTRRRAVRADGSPILGGRTVTIDGIAMIDDNDGAGLASRRGRARCWRR